MSPLHLDNGSAARFARLALDCVTREYPNKIAHVLASDLDARPPRMLTPAFYGCFDWHSAVHGHWLLARVLRLFPDAEWAPEARTALALNLTVERLAGEAEYLRARPGFERPYGLAWLLALDTEWPVPTLAAIAVEHLSTWLPKLGHPDRSGQHANTAFAMGLMLDWSRTARMKTFERLLVERARDFYLRDRNAPVAWEPSGEDFLSPTLAEADLMRRVLEPADFAPWLAAFLPDASSLRPVRSADRTDGKLAHADGLNLSRAWMLRAIGHNELAEEHAQAGLAAVTGERYEGGHWLGTFATYLLTS
ncbi:MAG: DUF2891 domain-containing protein [Bryobacteraceae bacterium]